MTFASLLDAFGTLHFTVLGDVMLDEYLIGRASRISQEAPVMVVLQTDRRFVPGGAANVAKNLVALGAQSTVVGVVGDDEAGKSLVQSMSSIQVEGDFFVAKERPTTKKTRVVADHSHQVLRIDLETEDPLDKRQEAEVLAKLTKALKGSNGLILSDYRKGVLSPAIVKAAIEAAQCQNIPVFANAKPQSAHLYGGAELVTMNKPEVSQFLGLSEVTRDRSMSAAQEVRDKVGSQAAVVTLGSEGFAVAGPDGTVWIDAPQVEAHDAAGAGDTAIATLALGVCARGFHPNVYKLAAEVAAKVVQHVGVAVPSAQDLAEVRQLRP